MGSPQSAARNEGRVAVRRDVPEGVAVAFLVPRRAFRRACSDDFSLRLPAAAASAAFHLPVKEKTGAL